MVAHKSARTGYQLTAQLVVMTGVPTRVRIIVNFDASVECLQLADAEAQ